MELTVKCGFGMIVFSMQYFKIYFVNRVPKVTGDSVTTLKTNQPQSTYKCLEKITFLNLRKVSKVLDS